MLPEVAKRLGTTPAYVVVLIHRGKLKAKKMGRNWVTTEEWINNYLVGIGKSPVNNDTRTYVQTSLDDLKSQVIKTVPIKAEVLEGFLSVRIAAVVFLLLFGAVLIFPDKSRNKIVSFLDLSGGGMVANSKPQLPIASDLPASKQPQPENNSKTVVLRETIIKEIPSDFRANVPSDYITKVEVGELIDEKLADLAGKVAGAVKGDTQVPNAVASSLPQASQTSVPVSPIPIYYVGTSVRDGGGSTGDFRYMSAQTGNISDSFTVGGSSQTTVTGSGVTTGSVSTTNLSTDSITSENLTVSGTIGQALFSASTTSYVIAIDQNGEGPAIRMLSAPSASTTIALLQLSDAPLSNGTSTGTYIGANPSSFTGNFIDFQVDGSRKFRVDSEGATLTGTLELTKGATVAHEFSVWATGAANTYASSSSLYINASSAIADGNLLGLAVNDNVKFIIDAEGDVFAKSLTTEGSVTAGSTSLSSLTVENTTFLGDAVGDNTFISGKLGVGTAQLTGQFNASSTSATIPAGVFAAHS